MSELQTGQPAPDFTLPADDAGEVSLSDFQGQKVVLYFYPKDDTPGCTKQACAFRDMIEDFKALGVQVLGVSKDSPAKHKRFKEKHNLNFPLVSDENGDVCERYGVWKEKSMYGKKYMGIERTTFLIDENSRVSQIWRKVKVPGHINEIREAARELAEAA